MQSDSAVVSMTLSPRSIASRCVSSGRNVASASSRGSPSYTPPTLFFAIRIASAPISSARSAAAVSVVKNGLPVPAAKITMRCFSRCRIARRRMYGSATSGMPSADWMRVSAPRCSSTSWSVSALRTRREHPRVVGGGAVHALRRRRHAAVDVPAADDERHLDAGGVDLGELRRDRLDALQVDAVGLVAHQRLARELQQDAAERFPAGTAADVPGSATAIRRARAARTRAPRRRPLRAPGPRSSPSRGSTAAR